MCEDAAVGTLRVVAEAAMTPVLDAAIRAALCDCFPDARAVFSKTRCWHGSGPAWTVVIEDDAGRVLAHVGIVDRTVTVGREDGGGEIAASLEARSSGGSFRGRVGGIQNVCVRPEGRGLGWGDRVMARAAQVMVEQKLDAGLLFCVSGLERYYGRLGWRALSGVAVIRTDEQGQRHGLPEDNRMMILPIGQRVWPAGPIDLNGDDW